MSRRWNRRVPLGLLAAFGLSLAALWRQAAAAATASKTRAAVDGTIDVNANDPYNFDVKTINASPGPLTVTLHEKGSQDAHVHDQRIRSSSSR